MVSACFFGSQFAFAQTNQADARIQTANAAVNQAFTSVLGAEKAGANVTSLLNQLNSANVILAQAENAYRTGDNSTALNDANAVLPIAQQVTSAAQTAKETAQISSRNAFWFTIVITVIASVVFILALSLVWRWLRQRYVKALFKAKPEMTVQ